MAAYQKPPLEFFDGDMFNMSASAIGRDGNADAIEYRDRDLRLHLGQCPSDSDERD